MMGIVFFVIASGLGKILPLLFGLYISNTMGHDGYVLFVGLLVLSNTLTTVSTISYTQLILGEGTFGVLNASGTIAFRCVCFSTLVSLAGGAWMVYFNTPNIGCSVRGLCWQVDISYLVVVLYSLGNSILVTLVAQFNAKLENKQAGTLIFFVLTISYSFAFALSSMGLSYYIVFSFLALIFSLASVIVFIGVNKRYLRTLTAKEIIFNIRKSIPFDRNQLYIIAFSGFVLLSHFISISKVSLENNHSVAAVFAIGYQLFSVGVFVPSIFGNIVIPRLAKGSQGFYMSVNYLIIGYAVVASAWVILVYFNHNLLLSWYGLEVNWQNTTIIMTLQFAVLLASLNALINQLLVAKRKFFFMAITSFLYLLSICIFGALMGFGGLIAAIGVLISYLLILIVSLIYLKMHSLTFHQVD